MAASPAGESPLVRCSPRRPVPSPRSVSAALLRAGFRATAPSPAGERTTTARPPRRPASSPRSAQGARTPAGCGATAPSPAGGMTAPAGDQPATGRYLHPGQRGPRLHLRVAVAELRLRSPLLGKTHLPPDLRRRPPYTQLDVGDDHTIACWRATAPSLAQGSMMPAARPSARHLHPGQRGQRSRLRGAQRRQRRLLGE